MRFNAPEGNVGLIAIDNTKEASIRFCDPQELNGYSVSGACRSITRIAVDRNVYIKDLNDCLREFREKTQDVFMTSFKGLRKDGWYRRRLDWNSARGIVNCVC